MMNQLWTRFLNQQPTVVRDLRHHFRRATGVLAIAGTLGIASAHADDPKGATTKPSPKGPTVRAETASEPVAMPECLEKLNLSSQQQTQIKEIARNYDSSLANVWKQFSARYMQAIAMETQLLAAIEDNLTDAQRQQVRDQRHKTAQHEKAIEANNEKSNQPTVQPASAVEDDLAGVGITLTSEQEAAADKIHEKYRSPLRSLKRDIQGLHLRLVSLEADKLVAIEKVLTKEQLTQLQENRQAAPDTQKLAISKVESTKKE